MSALKREREALAAGLPDRAEEVERLKAEVAATGSDEVRTALASAVALLEADRARVRWLEQAEREEKAERAEASHADALARVEAAESALSAAVLAVGEAIRAALDAGALDRIGEALSATEALNKAERATSTTARVRDRALREAELPRQETPSRWDDGTTLAFRTWERQRVGLLHVARTLWAFAHGGPMPVTREVQLEREQSRRMREG
jgi:hypothetical protein